jgi:hypothetical protein
LLLADGPCRGFYLDSIDLGDRRINFLQQPILVNVGVKVVLRHWIAFRWTALLDGRIMRFVRGVQASYRVFGAGGLFDLSDYHRVVRGCGAAALVLAVVFATTPQAAIAQDVSLTRIAQIYGISADPFGAEILYLATGRGFFAVGPDGLAQLLSPGTNKFTCFAADPGRAGRFIAAG